ncbi:hypothetical protein IV203_025619 [Nitzschia inconspicua]|uniref:Uncharacterized protein n=1 Tax=Nitzschia inconspicua TaxID=303405 RepID=A0A9K3K3W7_9STRA|nr:hypothetical protein IV203_033429 [Nitzschia inconspicua]KAG7361953.1 hypothetical protein IV203_025619 [Nitzschia inconspicua]
MNSVTNQNNGYGNVVNGNMTEKIHNDCYSVDFSYSVGPGNDDDNDNDNNYNNTMSDDADFSSSCFGPRDDDDNNVDDDDDTSDTVTHPGVGSRRSPSHQRLDPLYQELIRLCDVAGKNETTQTATKLESWITSLKGKRCCYWYYYTTTSGGGGKQSLLPLRLLAKQQ